MEIGSPKEGERIWVGRVCASPVPAALEAFFSLNQLQTHS
jgi:hypothetical protein